MGTDLDNSISPPRERDPGTSAREEIELSRSVPAHIRDVLGPGGRLATMLPGWEPRPAQLRMAGAVEEALRRRRPLLVEAGTGTGKTLAYLVPAILSGLKVVVSTGTKNLQEQILKKDIPLLAEYLETRFTAVGLKGIANYLCVRRSKEYAAMQYAREQ